MDYQRIKLSEIEVIDDPMPSNNQSDAFASEENRRDDFTANHEDIARIPKSFDIELREFLVNTCIVGDVIRIVGIVKAMQLDAPRYSKWGNGSGGKKGAVESGISQLYILASSIVCMKSSGNRTRQMIPFYSSIPGSDKSNSAQGSKAASAPVFLLDQSVSSATLRPNLSEEQAGGSIQKPNTSAFSTTELTNISRLALSNVAFPLLIENFCPSIFGHEIVKAGLLLSLFGGSNNQSSTTVDGGTASNALSASTAAAVTDEEKSFRVRRNIHVLVVGDPGLGKSQMLRAAASIAPRAIFVTGNTSTTAGLTVTVTRDIGGSGSRQGGELCIEAGALVLADNGICCIDELDKISCDQHTLLEAMEQQSISIAKSGIVTSLRSRAAVLAAANPAGGQYNRRKSVRKHFSILAS